MFYWQKTSRQLRELLQTLIKPATDPEALTERLRNESNGGQQRIHGQMTEGGPWRLDCHRTGIGLQAQCSCQPSTREEV
ncbi:Enolase 4 [Manis pentadactyla]|nr:Enolase 4 [Manis pentadactyla]